MQEIPQALLDGAATRVSKWMALFGVAGAAAFLMAHTPRMAAGFAVGAGLSILGYRWLERGMAAALDASRTRVPKSVGIKLMLRFPALIAALFFFYATGWLPVEGVLLGFFAPFAGALTESCIILGKGMFSSRH